MQFLPVTYLLSLLLLSSLADDICFSCASPELQYNWEVTNLPQLPTKDFTFTDDCKNEEHTELRKTCGSGVCYEAIIPLNNRVTYLRGCYSDFISDDTNYTRNNVQSDKAICSYGPVGNDQVQDITNKNSKPIQAYAGSRWCTNGANEKQGCNKELKYSAELFSSPADYFQERCPSPKQGQDKTCISCTHIGGNGDCSADTQSTCRGAYCVKYEGWLNGDSMVVRTCSPTNPYSGDVCEIMATPSAYPLFGVSPALPLPYWANHCFCTGDRCNPSSPVSSSLLVSLVLPLLLSRFLPFFSS